MTDVTKIKKYYFNGISFGTETEYVTVDEKEQKINFINRYYSETPFISLKDIETVLQSPIDGQFFMIYTFNPSKKYEIKCFKKLVTYINKNLKDNINRIKIRIKENNNFIKRIGG